MPLQRRVPKAGFKNINHKEYVAVNFQHFRLWLRKILPRLVKELGGCWIYQKLSELVKILGNGELKAKLDVEANAFSKTAEEAIKAVGGNATII
jgi:large subunit ribosomal protein L15